MVGGGSFAAVAAATVADDDDDRPFVQSVRQSINQPARAQSVPQPTHILSVF